MKLVVAFLTVATVGALEAIPAAAQDYRFCLEGGDFGAGDCRFSTYQQCLASASGRAGWCQANPYFRAMNEMPQSARTRRSRRSP